MIDFENFEEHVAEEAADFDEELWEQMRRDYYGWCAVCKDWTREQTEPDAEGYDCPSCDTPDSVIGADNYLMEYA